MCGGPGCEKTLLAGEFLVRGATQFNEPGVFITFEESSDELAKNLASLGFDLNQLTARKKLFMDHVRMERSEIQVSGEFDRLIKRSGARRTNSSQKRKRSPTRPAARYAICRTFYIRPTWS